ncbi:MAG TPA: TIR domain-containing protein [Thermoanaerobaculia bacterium]|nr:TIR domain-containing protein [Thermoanaerobaculia bacterium]
MRATIMASVFVSYSHKDGVWKDRLLRHFKALEQQGLEVTAWHDREIPGGGDWEAQIRAAMAAADAAVLLVSADFLASKFINEVEVPFLLARRANESLPVIPVVVLPCSWKLVPWLQKMNLRPPGGRPLSAGTEHEIEEHLVAIAEEVFRLVTTRSTPNPSLASDQTAPTRDNWRLVHPYGTLPNFTGRLSERRVLSEWLERENGPALLVLRALGGFGKTALVWHWLWNDVDPSRWPQVVWWSFYTKPSFDEFLVEVLGYLGHDAKALGVREGVRQLIETLRRSRVLLVLDGFERALREFSGLDAAYRGDEEEQPLGEGGTDCVSLGAQELLETISSFPSLSGRVLLTTRLRPRVVENRAGELLAGCREIELTALSKEDAVAFFRAEGVLGNRAEIETVCAQYGFHPLSLRLLAGLIVKDLKKPRDIAVAQRLDVSGDLIQRRHHVLEQSYASLPVEQKRLLSRIACFRGAVNYEALVAAAGGMPEGEVEAALQDLVERGLLHRDERDGRFDLHPIVRRYAYDFLGKEEQQETHRSLRDYFAAVPSAEKVKTLADLVPVIELYHHMVRAGEYDAAFEIFRDRLNEATYYQLGAYELRIELLRALFLDGEDQPPRLRDERDQAWTLGDLGNCYGLSGQPRRAVSLFERHNEICAKLDDKENLAVGLGSLASLAQMPIGALRSAEANLRREIELGREISDAWEEAIGHQALGRTLRILGRWEEAEGELSAALETLEEQRQVQSQGLIWAYRALLHLLHLRTTGALDFAETRASALAAAHRALELADETARTWHPYERDYVRAHWLLGAASRENGDLTEAEQHLGEALERCRRINMVESEADILIDLGRLRMAQGETAARRFGEEAVGIAARCGYVLQEADAHLLLSHLDKAAGEPAGAREHAARARELATCDGPPDYTYKVAYDEAGALLAEVG